MEPDMQWKDSSPLQRPTMQADDLTYALGLVRVSQSPRAGISDVCFIFSIRCSAGPRASSTVRYITLETSIS